MRFGYKGDKKSIVENYRSLDISVFRDHGLFKADTINSGHFKWYLRNGSSIQIQYKWDIISERFPHLRLAYTLPHNSHETSYNIGLIRTHPHYGGARYWFSCPQCKARRTKLYFIKSRFECRVCHDLSYQSRQQSPPFRLLEQSQKIYRILGGNPDYYDYFLSEKPIGMHWKTFDQKIAKMNLLRDRAEQAATERFG